jgi:hypothetical protein
MGASQRLVHEDDVADPGAGSGEVERLPRELERRLLRARDTGSQA